MNRELKRKLRLEYRAKRAQIPDDEKRESDHNITQELLNTDFYSEAQEILCYVSTKDEIDTKGIIADAFRRGKRVFVPKCTEQKGIMLFYQIKSFDDLKVGKYGIYEPANADVENGWHQTTERSVCIVPALCCDGYGNRLGYGGGYYDRFLREFSGKIVCLCYSLFSDVDIPIEQHDITCDVIIKG